MQTIVADDWGYPCDGHGLPIPAVLPELVDLPPLSAQCGSPVRYAVGYDDAGRLVCTEREEWLEYWEACR